MSATQRRPGSIVGFGMANVDTVAVVARYEADTKTVASELWEQVGGPVPVALMAVARLGARTVEFVSGSLGTDASGEGVRAWLQEDGVGTAHCPRLPNMATSRSLVLVEQESGRRFVANYGGDPPALTFTPAQEAVLRQASALHLDGRDLPAARLAAQLTRDGGGIVSFDLGTMRPGRAALFPLCNLLIASEKGGAGAYPDVAGDPVAQVQRFLADGAEVAGVTLGSRGVVIGSQTVAPRHVPSFAIPDARDSCGAGDCFHGAFLWAHLSGYPLAETTRFAQAAVACRLRFYGNRAGLPRFADVEAVLRQDQAS